MELLQGTGISSVPNTDRRLWSGGFRQHVLWLQLGGRHTTDLKQTILNLTRLPLFSTTTAYLLNITQGNWLSIAQQALLANQAAQQGMENKATFSTRRPPCAYLAEMVRL